VQTDTIKLIFTYTIAAIVIVGGGLMLFLARNDPADSGAQALQLVIAGFIGSAITFVFGQESATRATRAAQSSAAGAAATITGTTPPPPNPPTG
jgi:hypothetical protein